MHQVTMGTKAIGIKVLWDTQSELFYYTENS